MELLSPITSELNNCVHLLFCVWFFYYIFLKLIVTCRLWVICVIEDNDSNVYIMITWLIWITWTSLSTVWKRLLNLISHSVFRNDLLICSRYKQTKQNKHVFFLLLLTPFHGPSYYISIIESGVWWCVLFPGPLNCYKTIDCGWWLMG